MNRSQRPVWLGVDGRAWDHVRVHVQLLADGRIGAYELAVYLGVAAHAELSTGRAFPSASTLASYAGMSERQARRAIGRLEECGYLAVERTPGKALTFTLLPPPPCPTSFFTGTRTPDSQSGVSGSTPDCDDQHPGLTRPGTPDSQSDEQEPKNQNQEPKTSSSTVVTQTSDPATAASEEEMLRRAKTDLDREQARAARGERKPIHDVNAWLAENVRRRRSGLTPASDTVDDAAKAAAALRDRHDMERAEQAQIEANEPRMSRDRVAELARSLT